MPLPLTRGNFVTSKSMFHSIVGGDFFIHAERSRVVFR